MIINTIASLFKKNRASYDLTVFCFVSHFDSFLKWFCFEMAPKCAAEKHDGANRDCSLRHGASRPDRAIVYKVLYKHNVAKQKRPLKIFEKTK